MPCFNPIHSVRAADGSVVFRCLNPRPGETRVEVGCGRCIGCLEARAQDLATRIEHELQMHPPGDCWFVTPTYDEDHLPPGGGLVRRHSQDLLRAARKRFGRFRFFGCGEYGTESGRAHYHLILFGCHIPDAVYRYRGGGDKYDIFESSRLRECWPYGQLLLSRVEGGSVAAYVSGYVVKGRVLQHDGGKRVWLKGQSVTAPFLMYSTHPGIGASWLDRFGATDVWAHRDLRGPGGVHKRIPAYYRKRLKLADEAAAAAVSATLLERAKSREAEQIARGNWENSPERLRVREQCAVARRRRKATLGGLD
jgi:hypothetical protein